MVILFRLAYALAVAIFFILVVVFGQRTVISEPDFPSALYPNPQTGLYCDVDACYGRDGERVDENDASLTASEREYVRRSRAYQDDRQDYFRNVFVISVVAGMAAIAAGVYLFRRVEALPLGLVLGGIGVAIYGWVESSRGEGEMNETYAFIAAAIGFVVLMAGGYWFLGSQEKETPTVEPPPPKPELP